MNAINIFAAIFIATISMSAGEPIEVAAGANKNATIQLDFLGTVDGKSYFSDRLVKTWHDAAAFCKLTGMHLATITTQAQWENLVDKYDPTIFGSGHWVALRDSHLPRQFTWDNTGTEPSPSIGLMWDNSNNHVVDPITCVSFNSQPMAQSKLTVGLCTDLLRVLCET